MVGIECLLSTRQYSLSFVDIVLFNTLHNPWEKILRPLFYRWESKSQRKRKGGRGEGKWKGKKRVWWKRVSLAENFGSPKNVSLAPEITAEVILMEKLQEMTLNRDLSSDQHYNLDIFTGSFSTACYG